MKRLHLTLMALGTLLFSSLPVPADVREPDSFHWTSTPAKANIKSYDFDINHGRWTATMFRNDTMVKAEGHLGEADRRAFYTGLDGVGVWKLQSHVGAAGADVSRYRFTVTHHQDQHDAEFTGVPAPEYDAFVNFIHNSVVGKEEQVLLTKLSPVQPAVAPTR